MRYTPFDPFVVLSVILFAGAARGEKINFAIIGDFGQASVEQAVAANLITNTFKPDFIVTVGDNNYLPLSVESYDTVVGQFYSPYIGHYKGKYGRGSATNRFWPALGNHDWGDPMGYQPYLDYFTLPGNERYYDFVVGPIHFFMLNSDRHEPDGRSRTSIQAKWLKERLAASKSPWKFVVLHHPPFSSSDVHGSHSVMQWPFKHWGAHAVLAGHDHTYERLNVGGLPYFVNGIGGKSLYGLGKTLPQTKVLYNADYGGMRVWADETQAVFEAFSITDGMTRLDSFTLTHDMIVPDLIPPAATWKYLDDGSDQQNWHTLNFDDSSWKTGITQLGYGDEDESTVIQFGPDPKQKHITTYFRHTFMASNIETIQKLTLSLLRDDGAAVYINGIEAARMNMPAGQIGFHSRASSAVAKVDENKFYEVTLDPTVLVEGLNVIAVEVHQSSRRSSDCSFDLMLTPIPKEVPR